MLPVGMTKFLLLSFCFLFWLLSSFVFVVFPPLFPRIASLHLFFHLFMCVTAWLAICIENTESALIQTPNVPNRPSSCPKRKSKQRRSSHRKSKLHICPVLCRICHFIPTNIITTGGSTLDPETSVVYLWKL